MLPELVLNPKIPFKAAGIRMLPAKSDPIPI